jgi:hypothetical protein
MKSRPRGKSPWRKTLLARDAAPNTSRPSFWAPPLSSPIISPLSCPQKNPAQGPAGPDHPHNNQQRYPLPPHLVNQQSKATRSAAIPLPGLRHINPCKRGIPSTISQHESSPQNPAQYPPCPHNNPLWRYEKLHYCKKMDALSFASKSVPARIFRAISRDTLQCATRNHKSKFFLHQKNDCV